ncbi:hypothetical protein CANARDRAFT_26746 [[Candida] arabinofermentans NRRL YB-2248]|uniref:Uncharacterized protein n=1 Tax=[Candida] arabinofermentans NRRL YB-2248 TaxID=983967 RepID=A0A1E4T6K6_9ASCO|nr:hypothetical protein CANARDRAFT_26746 [[Candida] arabinofermentans NRRL YB-2248]
MLPLNIGLVTKRHSQLEKPKNVVDFEGLRIFILRRLISSNRRENVRNYTAYDRFLGNCP